MEIVYAHHNHGSAVMLYVTVTQPRITVSPLGEQVKHPPPKPKPLGKVLTMNDTVWQAVEIAERPVSWRQARRQYRAMRQKLLAGVSQKP